MCVERIHKKSEKIRQMKRDDNSLFAIYPPQIVRFPDDKPLPEYSYPQKADNPF